MRAALAGIFVAFVLFSMVLSSTVSAQSAAGHGAEPLQILLQQQNELKAKLDSGQTERLNSRQVSAIRKAQKEVFAITESKPALASLSINEKIRLDNALERINAEIKGTRVSKEQQDECWRERKSGSTVMVTRCGTQEEKEHAREGARGFLERPRACGKDCGG